MLVHKSNPESIPTPLHIETVNIVDTYMYMVVETNEFAREYRVRKNYINSDLNWFLSGLQCTNIHNGTDLEITVENRNIYTLQNGPVR